MLDPRGFPFILHLLVEVPACINFFIFPSDQLRTPAPQAHAVIRQYAILLLSSNLIAATFASTSTEGTTARLVGGALGIYHVAPGVRALCRIRKSGAMAQPVLHLIAHSTCLVMFAVYGMAAA